MAFQAYKSEGVTDAPGVYYTSRRSRQNRPYEKPLPYEFFLFVKNGGICRYTMDNGAVAGQPYTPYFTTLYAYAKSDFLPFALSTNQRNIVHNKALDKIVDELQVVSNMFEAWYERKEAMSLMAQAGKGIFKFLTNWRKPKYWKGLFKGSKKAVKRPETLPEAWLLANFAVKPLIGTIDDCMNLLCSDWPVMKSEGASGTKGSSHLPLSDKNTTDILTYDWEYIVKHGVRFKGLNPNKALLNAMGLTTPVSSFLNVVPWFWAVNYFVNVNNMVSNFEERFPGIQILDSYTTTLFKTQFMRSMGPSIYRSYWTPSGWKTVPEAYAVGNGHTIEMKRVVNQQPPSYKLQVGFPPLGSSQFANLFSAIALVMKGSKK